MNSRQRRQDRRQWTYSITTVAQDWDHYNAMWMWLKARHGTKVDRCGWRDRIDDRNSSYSYQVRYNITWQFQREHDAIEFALRWV